VPARGPHTGGACRSSLHHAPAVLSARFSSPRKRSIALLPVSAAREGRATPRAHRRNGQGSTPVTHVGYYLARSLFRPAVRDRKGEQTTERSEIPVPNLPTT
jgi:hypothetical protein